MGLTLALILPASNLFAQAAGELARPSRAADGAVGRAELAASERSPLLTLDQDRLFQETARGRAALARAETAAQALVSENRSIELDLEAEELALTQTRATMSPLEFSTLARSFDMRVEEFRAQQENKSRAIARQIEDERQAFFAAILPILAELMAERGAVAITAKETLILSLNAIDVTDEAILLIDNLPDPAQEGGVAEPLVENDPKPGADALVAEPGR